MTRRERRIRLASSKSREDKEVKEMRRRRELKNSKTNSQERGTKDRAREPIRKLLKVPRKRVKSREVLSQKERSSLGIRRRFNQRLRTKVKRPKSKLKVKLKMQTTRRPRMLKQ